MQDKPVPLQRPARHRSGHGAVWGPWSSYLTAVPKSILVAYLRRVVRFTSPPPLCPFCPLPLCLSAMIPTHGSFPNFITPTPNVARIPSLAYPGQPVRGTSLLTHGQREPPAAESGERVLFLFPPSTNHEGYCSIFVTFSESAGSRDPKKTHGTVAFSQSVLFQGPGTLARPRIWSPPRACGGLLLLLSGTNKYQHSFIKRHSTRRCRGDRYPPTVSLFLPERTGAYVLPPSQARSQSTPHAGEPTAKYPSSPLTRLGE